MTAFPMSDVNATKNQEAVRVLSFGRFIIRSVIFAMASRYPAAIQIYLRNTA